MTYIKTALPADDQGVAECNTRMETMFMGMVPKVFTAMNMRSDLLDPLLTYVQRLMIEEKGLNRLTKELLAAHVSTLNSCAY